MIDLGSLRIDPANECLVREGETIPLRPKAFATLMLLVRNPQRIVTKQEILDSVWSDAVVGDAVLKVCIRELRVALGDSSKAPQFIETVHRRGYRFLVAPAETVAAQEPTPLSPAVSALAPVAPGAPIAPLKVKRLAPEHQPSIIGRRTELESLGECLRQAQGGSRQLVLLSGDAGIGKTSVVRSFQEQAPHTHFVQGSCREQFGSGEPFLPVLEALGALIGHDPTAPIVQQLREWAPTWFVQFPWLVSQTDRTLLEREILGSTRQRMLREMAEFLEAATAKAPLTIVLEDLHWSDPSTLDLIATLALRSQPARLLILATYRPIDIIVQNHPMRRARRDLLRCSSASELSLAFLTELEVRDFLEQRLGCRDFPDTLASWLLRKTDGSPLFLVQIVDYIQQQGWLHEGQGSWSFDQRSADTAKVVPGNLREMIVEDLTRCSDFERSMLEAASLAGFHFSSESVAAALDQDPADVESAANSLASRGQFIRETGWVEFPDGSACTSYAFTHHLWQQALASSIAPGSRTRMQRRLAERCERAFGDRAAEAATDLALHFEEARIPARAIYYAGIAAERAQERQAYLEADVYLVKALTLSEALPEGERRATRAALLQQLGIVRRSMGDMPAASETFELWAAESKAQGELADEAKALLLCASSTSWLDKTRCLDHVARARELHDLLPDQASQAHVLGSCAYWELLWDGWKQGQEEAMNQASEAAWAADSAVTANQHDVRLSFLQALRGDFDRAASTAEAARIQAIELGDPSEKMLAEFYGSWALIEGCQWERAQEWIQAAKLSAERNGNRPWIILLGLMHSYLLLRQGQLDEAAREVQEIHAAALADGLTFGERYARVLLGTILLEQGSLDAAYELLAGVHADLESEPGLLGWFTLLPCELAMGRCALRRSLPDQATNHAQRGIELAGPMGAPRFLADFQQLLNDSR